MEEAWKIARRLGSYLQYLGIQGAARKRGLNEGPWVGGIFSTTDKRIAKTDTKEKWLKAKILFGDLVTKIGEDHKKPLLYKKLERVGGFLCHMVMVYETIFSYLR